MTEATYMLNIMNINMCVYKKVSTGHLPRDACPTVKCGLDSLTNTLRTATHAYSLQ